MTLVKIQKSLSYFPKIFILVASRDMRSLDIYNTTNNLMKIGIFQTYVRKIINHLSFPSDYLENSRDLWKVLRVTIFKKVVM